MPISNRDLTDIISCVFSTFRISVVSLRQFQLSQLTRNSVATAAAVEEHRDDSDIRPPRKSKSLLDNTRERTPERPRARRN